MNFAVTGVAGYIAPRHLKAIHETGNRIIAAYDPNDSVGRLDQYSYTTRFFTELERFDRYLETLRKGPEENRLNFLSICSPNYLHDAHCRLALRVGANALCEKPLVINPWNLDALQEIENEYSGRIFTVLQLRLHPKLVELREKLRRESMNYQHDVCLTYITPRGSWYHASWKGNPEKSGGIATNIGIHFFDLILWLFGEAGENRVYFSDSKRISGFTEFAKAKVKWFLSIDSNDLPYERDFLRSGTFRSIQVDGEEIEFTDGFTDLHTLVYKETIAGNGFGIEDARPSIELVHRIRNSPTLKMDLQAHPFLK